MSDRPSAISLPCFLKYTWDMTDDNRKGIERGSEQMMISAGESGNRPGRRWLVGTGFPPEADAPSPRRSGWPWIRPSIRPAPDRAHHRFGWVEASFLVLVLLALGLRLWELDGRAIHYDEGIHIHYAWLLANSEGGPGGWPWIFGRDYRHAPWMHGPFQIEFTAIIFGIFGDTDFTARLGYVLLGTALVGLPYFLRSYLGRTGAVLVGLLLAVSPVMLYFSRFGREDMPMVFWTTALLVLMWRYVRERKDRYLYLASAVLALMFATKESAYFVALIFGAMMFLLALPDLIPWVRRRRKLSDFTGPAGFLVLLVTLTLPQWSAATGFIQDTLGVRLVNPDGVVNGVVGAPHWVEPFVALPVYSAPGWFHGLAVVLLAGGLFWVSRLTRGYQPHSFDQSDFVPGQVGVDLRSELRTGANPSPSGGRDGPPPSREKARGKEIPLRGNLALPAAVSLVPGIGVPLAMVAATCLVLFRPIGEALGSGSSPLPVIDLAIAGIIGVAAIGVLALRRHPWKQAALLLIIPALLTAVYAALFTQVVNVDTLVNGLLPQGVRVDVTSNGVPVNFLVAGGVLAFTFVLSIYLGVSWRGGVWLACAAIFYGIWLTLYTTFFTKGAGFFSGIWQGLGYWIAQQDVARGGQPWYYYLVSLSVYELLPLIFGLLGAFYFLKKRDVFGLALAFWAGLTFLAYTIASEKMPWLMVHVTLPLIFLAGKYLGALVERVPWRQALRRGHFALLVLSPLWIVLGVYWLMLYVDPQGAFSGLGWIALVGLGLLAVALAYLVRLARPDTGIPLVGLGVAALLLGFAIIGGFRAIYTFDDSYKEMLVYAQGSAQLPETFRVLDSRVFRSNPQEGAVEVDYDLWYPFNWYVRHQQRAGKLVFHCFKNKGEEGWHEFCSQVPKSPDAPAILLSANHVGGELDGLGKYQREGPYRNLIWFPEIYRRPGENRQAEGLKKQLAEDFAFFQRVAASRRSWHAALDYVIFRRLDGPWYQSEYYSYLARG